MNCRQTTTWLLQADDLRWPPAEVAEHVQQCVRCRRRRARLRRLHRVVATLPAPAVDPALQTRILANLAPPFAAASPAARPVPWRWRALLTRAAMILLLIGGIAVLALDVGNPDPANRAQGADSDFVGRLVTNHIRVAEGLPLEERCKTFAEMGRDLRREAVRQAWQGDHAEITALASLYERVLRQGVLDHVAHLPIAQRRLLVPRLVDELQQSEGEANRAAAAAPPEVAAALHGIAQCAHDVRGQLANLGGEKSL